MAIPQKVVKPCTTSKHPNKDKPKALLKLCLEDFLHLLNSPDKKQTIYCFNIKKISSFKQSISSANIGLAISSQGVQDVVQYSL